MTAEKTAAAQLIQLTLDDAQVEAATLLRQLDSYRDQLRRLRDSRQPGIPFVPRSTREAIGRQYVAERKAQAAARAAGYPSTLGNTHSPGNLAVWTLDAEIETTLVDVRRRILAAHVHRGTCAVPRRVYHRVTKESLFGIVRELIFSIPTVALARAVNRDLQHLVEQADRLIEGDERTELDGECPHCGRRTLVVYLREGRITCERPRDPNTKRRPPCSCSDPLCGCRTDPVGYVHTWFRARPAGAADSWEALSGRLNITHLARKAPR
jgi:hypothetical protein